MSEAAGRLELIEDRFSNLQSIVEQSGAAPIDGVVFDLGVSSMQLDEGARGFSFRLDGPLDMRMGRDGPSAADVVARASERDLAAIIATLGEERHARAIARAIVESTSGADDQLDAVACRDLLRAWCRLTPSAIHPATRTFQALRIFVNDELGELASGLAAAERCAEARRASCGDRVPLAGRSHRENLPGRAQPRAGVFPPSAACGRGSADLPRAHAPAGNAGGVGNRRQSAGSLRQAARRRAHRCGAARTPVASLLPRLPSLAEIMRGRPDFTRVQFALIGAVIFIAFAPISSRCRPPPSCAL